MLNPQPPKPPLTVEEIEVRIWGFVVVMVTLVLVGIVAMLLYSVTFVTQPIKSMAPIDQAYTKMLNDIVLLIVGGIGGVMGKKGVGAMARNLAPQPPGYCPTATTMGVQPPKFPAHPTAPDWNWMGYQNPDLDESWVPPPPPTTPADYIDPAAEEIALERALARTES